MLTQEVIKQMKQNLKNGVTVQVTPQLFPTPKEIAEKMGQMLDFQPSDKILEPSAGTGVLVGVCGGIWHPKGRMVAIEINHGLCESLKRNFPLTEIHNKDFSDLTPDLIGTFNKIIINPPFCRNADINHILHAFRFLEKGGILVSIVCEGPFFKQGKKSKAFRDFLDSHCATVITLPDGTFKESGTMVKTRLICIKRF